MTAPRSGGFLALVPGHGAGQRIQKDVLAVFPDARRDIVVLQRSRELGQHLGRLSRHLTLLALHCVADRAGIMRDGAGRDKSIGLADWLGRLASHAVSVRLLRAPQRP